MFGKDSMTDVRSTDDRFVPYVRLFKDVFDPDFILMGYNALSDKDQLVDKFLESEDIHLIDWPVRPLVLNHIENVWDALESKSKLILYFRETPK